jgi:hypothetical protein
MTIIVIYGGHEMVVVKENEKKNLEWLERVSVDCPEELNVKGFNFKFMISYELANVKWKLDRKNVEDWCERKKVELNYFETVGEYGAWLNKIKCQSVFKNTKIKLEQETEKIKQKIEKVKIENVKKNEDLKRELIILQVGGLPE